MIKKYYMNLSEMVIRFYLMGMEIRVLGICIIDILVLFVIFMKRLMILQYQIVIVFGRYLMILD